MKGSYYTVVQDDTISYRDEGGEILSIQEICSQEDKTAQMVLSGQLLSLMSYELQDELLLLLTCGMNVTMDFSKVKIFSNSCQKAVVEAAEKQRKFHIPGDFKLENVPEDIFEELKKRHFNRIIDTRMKGGKKA